MNWSAKQTAIAFNLSVQSNKGPKEPWIANGAFDPTILERDYAMRHIAWGVTSQIANFFLIFQVFF
jgi:hypothetical protein